MECVACQTELFLTADDGHGDCHACGASYYLSNSWVLPAFAVPMKAILTEDAAPDVDGWTFADEAIRLERTPHWSSLGMGRSSRASFDRARLEIEHRARSLMGIGGIDDRVEIPTSRLRHFVPVGCHVVEVGRGAEVVVAGAISIGVGKSTKQEMGRKVGLFALADAPIELAAERRPVVHQLPQWLQGRFFFVDELKGYAVARSLAGALNRTLQRWSTGYR